MPDILTGKLKSNTYFKRLVRIWSSKITIGVITSEDGKRKLYTSLSVFVPKPRHASDTPGVFISLSNANGAAFVRVDPVEFDTIVSHLQSLRSNIQSAFNEASQTHEIWERAERIARSQISEQAIKSVSDEQRAYIEEQKEYITSGFKTLMEQEPHQL